MGFLNLTAKEIYRSLPKKLHLRDVRSNREQYGDYYLDGKYQFKVVMPNIHGGSGAVSRGLLKVCRDSVRLNTRGYFDLVRCPMTGEEYDDIIREKIRERYSDK